MNAIPALFRLLLLGVLAVIAGCKQDTPPASTPPVVLIAPVAAEGSDNASFNGEIRARHEADLAFRVGGKLMQRLVDAFAQRRQSQ